MELAIRYKFTQCIKATKTVLL